MGSADLPRNDAPAPDTAAERRLRGDALEGSEQNDAVDHSAYQKTRNPDTELRLNDEKDTLYNDGLDIKEDSDTLAGTRGKAPPSGMKP